MREYFGWIIAVLLVLAVIATPIVLWNNWNYRWTQECARQGGVRMGESDGAGRVCVREPVQLITIAAKPW